MAPETSGPLGKTELAIVLGSINLTFIAFVAIQARYFFGGADVVAITPDLTYAEYARRGFFELVWVSGLALPLLLALDASKRQDSGARTLFRVLAAITILLLFIVMISGLQRMRLYMDEFGLTELRLYPTAFMAWLFAVFAWFAATILRGRPRGFVFGALVAGLCTLAALDILNPDAFIARLNVDRPPSSRPMDLDYLLSLSADATPTLIDAIAVLAPQERRTAAERLLQRWHPGDPPDWRTFNVGRAAARSSVERNRVRLEGQIGGGM